MSLCYDFEKWTMVTLASVAISLIVGLVLMQVVHGYKHPLGYSTYKGCIDYWNNGTLLENATISLEYMCGSFPAYDTYQDCIDNWKDTIFLKEHNFTIEEICGGYK